VATVIPYYQRFMARFPDARSLADAPIDEVLHLWTGLGYYARARNLHALARTVMRRYDGTLPADPEDLVTLPGVGRYTAGAIACFAFEQPVATVDTNIARVIRRVFGLRDGRRRTRRIWEIAERLVPRDGKRAWRFNQAIMELGATVCVARNPKCPLCPVRQHCRTGKARRTDAPRRTDSREE
jgi:A/G-specific adenine glycosylase